MTCAADPVSAVAAVTVPSTGPAASSSSGGHQLIVRNTFLELFEETAVPEPLEGGRRPRVVSDMTDLRLPQKVQYQPSGFADSRPALGLGTSSTSSGDLFVRQASPAATPLVAVSEETVPLQEAVPLPSLGLSRGVTPEAPGTLYQAYSQVHWSGAPAQAMTAAAVSYTAPGASLSGLAAAPSPAQGAWGYPTYQAAPYAAPYATPSGGLGVASMQPSVQGRPMVASYVGAQPQAAAQPASMVHHASLQGQHAAMALAPRVEASSAMAPSAAASAAPFGEFVAQGEPTTVMLRNIPNRYTQSHLVNLLDENGFRSKYDFVYLPMDFRNGVNLGYAFVNLLSHQVALRAIRTFQGFAGWFYESNKVCEVSWAHPHQGLEEHVERYRNSPVMHQCMPDEYKPMLFKGGVHIPFPPPTKAIRAPKLRPVRDRPQGD